MNYKFKKLMNNTVNLLIIFSAFMSITAARAQSVIYGNTDEVSRLISQKDCGGAEAYARGSFQRPLIYTMLGLIALDCKNQKAQAVEYFKMAARENETVALEMLVNLGEKLVDAKPKYGVPPGVYRAPEPQEEMTLPPSHTFSPMPQPRQPQRQIILIAPTVIQPFNAAACIQDGGGTYCPYYRR